MLVLNEEQTRTALAWPALIEAIASMFTGDCVMPVRHHHDMEVPGESEATLLLMPAWLPGQYMGVKMVSVFPDNATRALPAIFGTYLLSSGKTGEMLAVIDGGELTARRTAATSALAARYLARTDAEDLLVCGSGRLSLNLIQAHAEGRSLKRIGIWGRDLDKAEHIASQAQALGLNVIAVTDLEAAARSADIISCGTLSSTPLIKGEWLKPGAHLDLVGGFKPDMRETDDTAIRRAEVFVDTRAGAMKEAGDIVQPLKSGVLTEDTIRAELSELVRGTKPGRSNDADITLFKSVGAALEDLAGAILAYEYARGRQA
ncbi:ornithine cyclodeaminase family protein [Agrobacterium sp. SHOUNA12C]|uniref:ornithine cyclodeaminase family protein n=1 Tax=Rhizobium rhizogenes TaxID=359 RepID=UPI0006463912|nr:ornithine cyclodeaminase family protein [Rhizobium rhizogenes]KAA6482737.1 ornithine cyclodeaminase family protein [Agrobacterium sp. ICMP 7243]MCJ9725635.1 ornithine cyclodeaminase family protein [Agrobacterium sp. BETTINA12B]MCJ9761481.1 ornithine cyclodeaminase family protein [Agrobacterium sp. SHOUNA12C]OCI91560.1 ornithine cyclodeaminase [Agrobacterium sp. 13-626]NTF50489.1 ornithine cyclodeaminase family protein [Rhizobium rhizogenes]